MLGRDCLVLATCTTLGSSSHIRWFLGQEIKRECRYIICMCTVLFFSLGFLMLCNGVCVCVCVHKNPISCKHQNLFNVCGIKRPS